MKTYDFDQYLADSSPELQAAVEERFNELNRAFPLSALRNECALSQSEIAEALRVSQAAISKMEARSDMLISTVYRYVKALGGSMGLSISLEDKDFVIRPANDKGTAFILEREHRQSPAELFSAVAAIHSVRRSRENVVQELWQRSREAMHEVTVHAPISAAVANDHFCGLLADAA